MRHDIYYHCPTTCEECRRWRQLVAYRVFSVVIYVAGFALIAGMLVWRMSQ